MNKNRFLKSQRLSEQEFTGVAYDYLLGANATSCAERLSVSEKTVRKYYGLIRQRLIEDVRILEFSKTLPAASHAVWQDIAHCCFECPSNADSVHKTSEDQLGLFLSGKEEEKRNPISRKIKLTKCAQCPFEVPFELAYRIRLLIDLKRAAMRDPKSEEFKEEYVEAMMRSLMLSGSSTWMINHNLVANMLLQSCEINPL